MYFSARTEGRISYGHLGRTNLFTYMISKSGFPRRIQQVETMKSIRDRREKVAWIVVGSHEYACRLTTRRLQLRIDFDSLSFYCLSHSTTSQWRNTCDCWPATPIDLFMYLGLIAAANTQVGL